MGDPRRLKKAFSKPTKPWDKARIDEEVGLEKNYGLKKKEEIYRARSILRKFAHQSKRLVALRGAQAEKEKKQLLSRLVSFGLLKPGQDLDAVLRIGLKDILDRRLQTVLFKKGLTTTVKQARQAIVHGHIYVGNRKMTSPSYLLPLSEENMLRIEKLVIQAERNETPRSEKPQSDKSEILTQAESS